MTTARGLGRGLGALIPRRANGSEPESVAKTKISSAEPRIQTAAGLPLYVPIERVLPNPHQPRERFGHGEMEELVASVKAHGIIQPLVATEKPDGTFELVAGERRLRAARLSGLISVPVTIRGAGEREKLELALVENLQRQDLNPLEEARAYRRLAGEYGLSQEEISQKVGKSRSQIANTLRLLDLPEEVRQAVASGELPASAARTLLSLESKDEQLNWWQKITAEKLSVREVEEAVRRVARRARILPDARMEDDLSALRSALGTKVAIKKRGEAGRIELSFFSEEEYRELVGKLVGRVRDSI